MLARPFAASAPTPRRAGTAGSGTPICSATTRSRQDHDGVLLKQLQAFVKHHWAVYPSGRVSLDGFLVSNPCFIRVEPRRPPGPSLAEQVPALV